MTEFVSTHGEAMRMAIKALRDAGGETQNAAANTIETDLLPDEEDWELENGFRDSNGKFYPNGDAPEGK